MNETAQIISNNFNIKFDTNLALKVRAICEDVVTMINITNGEFFHGSRDFYNLL